MQRRIRLRCDELFKRRHELRDAQVCRHAGKPVIAGCDNSEKLSVR